MNNNWIFLIVIAAIILGLGAWVTLGSKKRQWYKVYLANNDVLLLYRDLNERWWRTSDRYMRFKRENGVEVTFPQQAHWILWWEAVPEKDLERARNEVQRIKELAAREAK